MKIEKTNIPDLYVITPTRFGDERGFFEETWNRQKLLDAGIDVDWVQDNRSLSAEPGTMRGLHYQAPPHSQAKLVRCAKGALMDVGVDIRVGSPTYGQWHGEVLTDKNAKIMLVPTGFAHGFMTLEPDTEVNYKCSELYAPQVEGMIRFDDPAIGIDWGFKSSDVILSEKDAAAPMLADIKSPFRWGG